MTHLPAMTEPGPDDPPAIRDARTKLGVSLSCGQGDQLTRSLIELVEWEFCKLRSQIAALTAAVGGWIDLPATEQPGNPPEKPAVVSPAGEWSVWHRASEYRSFEVIDTAPTEAAAKELVARSGAGHYMVLSSGQDANTVWRLPQTLPADIFTRMVPR